jgi:hypothetical protein
MGASMNMRRLLASSLAGALGLAVLAAAPASAYPRDDYAYAASHMIGRSDIPAVLGAFKKDMIFSAFAGGRVLACDVPQADPTAPDVQVRYPGGRYAYGAGYFGRGNDAPSINIQVDQYATATAAIKAFRVLQKNIAKCTGTGTNTYTVPVGTTVTYSTQLTNGVVPEVTTLGVESLFVSSNTLSVSTPTDVRNVNDQYAVFSLFGDVIIQTQYYSSSTDNLTTKQRKAVNQVAFNAESAWLAP